MNNAIEVGQLFQLIGQRLTFRCTNTYLAAGFIPSVHGETLDGLRQTNARQADVIRVEGGE